MFAPSQFSSRRSLLIPGVGINNEKHNNKYKKYNNKYKKN
jgi:hypothetical protein